jgi:hypothetical protein
MSACKNKEQTACVKISKEPDDDLQGKLNSRGSPI